MVNIQHCISATPNRHHIDRRQWQAYGQHTALHVITPNRHHTDRRHWQAYGQHTALLRQQLTLITILTDVSGRPMVNVQHCYISNWHSSPYWQTSLAGQWLTYSTGTSATKLDLPHGPMLLIRQLGHDGSSIFQALNKLQKLNQNKISLFSFIFHRF